MTLGADGYGVYIELAEEFWRTAPNDIARAASAAGGDFDTRVVTDMLALKMEAREWASSEGERAAITKLAIRLGRFTEPEVQSFARALSVAR